MPTSGRASVAAEKNFPRRCIARPTPTWCDAAVGKTIIAGYPWFGDWGRDTFIAIRGLCIATGRLTSARDILVEWAGVVSEGMLPNRFPDQGDQPEFNSVDASLWYIVAVGDYLRAIERKPQVVERLPHGAIA